MTGSRYLPCLPVAAAAVLAVVLAVPLSVAESADAGYWIDTWTASPQPIWDAEFPVPLNIPRALRNQTVRQIVRVSIGGNRIRVVFSNEYGSKPLMIDAAQIALAGAGAAITADSDRALSFGGDPSVTVPPGAPVVSDPVDLKVAPLSSVAVNLFLPEQTPLTTVHWEGESKRPSSRRKATSLGMRTSRPTPR